MGFSVAADNAALTGMISSSPPPVYVALLNSSGTEVSSARVGVSWGTPSGGSVTAPQVSIDVPGGVTVHEWALYTALTGGTPFYSGNLPADETYGSAGTYLLTPTLTAS